MPLDMVNKRLTEKLDRLRVWPTTKSIVAICAAIEGMPLVQFVDKLIVEYATSRGLQDSIAEIQAHVERAEAERLSVRKKLYKEIKADVRREAKRKAAKRLPPKGMSREEHQAVLQAQVDEQFEGDDDGEN